MFSNQFWAEIPYKYIGRTDGLFQNKKDISQADFQGLAGAFRPISYEFISSSIVTLYSKIAVSQASIIK